MSLRRTVLQKIIFKNNKRDNQFKNYIVENGIHKRKKMFSNVQKKIKSYIVAGNDMLQVTPSVND